MLQDKRPNKKHHATIRLLCFLFVAILVCAVAYVIEFRRYAHKARDFGQLNFRDSGVEYMGFVVNPNTHNITLISHHPQGRSPLSLSDASKHVEGVEFATNGGIFKSPNEPNGLTVSNGAVLQRIDTSDGRGNFYLKPNGVFFVTNENRAGISSSVTFNEPVHQLRLATQSGPLLVSSGRLHPGLREYSPNKRIRSGVGVRRDGTIIFVVSIDPVRFWDIATLLRDGFECLDALYLDGTISGAIMNGRRPSTSQGYASLLVVSPRKSKP